MNIASVKRWGWTLLLYAAAAAALYFVMKDMYEGIGITPSGYQDFTWWMALQSLLINATATSFVLLILWNVLYSYPLLGGGLKGFSVYVWMLVFVVIHLLSSIALLFYTVLPILLTVSDASIPLYARLLLEWDLAYGVDFVALHFLPALLIVPFLLGITFFGPECIAHKFFFNPIRSKVGLKYVRS